MKIRAYRSGDLDAVLSLFRDTVHSACAADYTPAQREAWAPVDLDRDRWSAFLAENIALVAVEDGVLAGFGDLTRDGRVNTLYAGKDWQGKGVGAALLTELETRAATLGLTRLRADVSLTARPFFERKGYVATARQRNRRRGEVLVNFRMEKTLLNR